jgi:hypothetical protein
MAILQIEVNDKVVGAVVGELQRNSRVQDGLLF